jgi:hypothetical protein
VSPQHRSDRRADVSYALGQPVPLRALVRDVDGNLDNAEFVTLVITLPDGTTVTPTVANPPAVTGTYVYDYTPTLPGLYTVRWIFSGINTAAPPLDSFYVDPGPTGLPPLVSLAEAREQCRVYSVEHDALLQRYMRVASGHCERRTQLWRRQSLAKTADGGGELVRLMYPIISITTVAESGISVASTDYTPVLDDGLLYRGPSTTCGYRWAYGRQNVSVTYVGGVSSGIVPDEIRQGCLLLVEHLWNTQRGGSRLPRTDDGSDWTLPVGFTIPNAVLEQWGDWIREMVA